MRKITAISFSFVLLFLFMFAKAGNAQSTPKVIMVMQGSMTCQACIDNLNRWGADVLPKYSGSSDIVFVTNDMTDDKTKASSATEMDKYGITAAVTSKTEVGKVLIVSGDSKAIITELDITDSSDNVIKAINDALGK